MNNKKQRVGDMTDHDIAKVIKRVFRQVKISNPDRTFQSIQSKLQNGETIKKD